MPVSLISVKIKGIRSYSPKDELGQIVEFMPLTLIVGANGTGKTTVIEALKFIISGEEPPRSDSRRNFIHSAKDEKFFHVGETYASVEIRFENSSGELCIAKRDITLPDAGRNATPSISSSYKIGANIWVNVHRQDDWNKIMPRVFGLPNQALLSMVILCHQEDNNWCMGESSSVKQIFDKIFGCEQYKKEIRHIDDEIKVSRKDLALSEKDIETLGEKVQRKKAIVVDIEKSESELEQIDSNSKSLDVEVVEVEEKRKFLVNRISELEIKSREMSSLKQRANELKERETLLRRSLQQMSNRRRKPLKPPAAKKQASDPTASDLSIIMENLERMSLIVDKLEPSSESGDLKTLLNETLRKIEQIHARFASPKIEPPEELESEEDEEDEQDKEYRLSIEKNIKDNLSETEKIKESIIAIQQQIKDDENLNRTKQELRDIEQKLISLRDKRSRLSGTKYQLERDLNRMKSELSSYKKVNILYAQSLGKFVCNDVIVSDLEKLKKCFHDSITNFHNQMIMKINEALRSRWRQIYQGKDIETIELVDEEITRGKDKKSYNYFMAMRKNGIRMKMRDKSSAGQKALASIILRMTLAELFVRDFAFIALDEPTANLDLCNVQALAKSIGAYVRKRSKKGGHIQWIIITHDEQFLRALDEECSPFFYRIEMNEDGFSKIVKNSYRDVELEPQT